MRKNAHNLSAILLVCGSLGLFFGCAVAGSRALKSDSVGIPFASVEHEDESMRGQYGQNHLQPPPAPNFTEADYYGTGNNGNYGVYNEMQDIPWDSQTERKPTQEDRQNHMKRQWDEFRAGRRTEDIPQDLRPLPPLRGPFENRDPVSVSEIESFLQVGVSEPYAERPDFNIGGFEDWEIEEARADWSKVSPEKVFTQVRDMLGMGPDEAEANQLMKDGKAILESNKDLKDVAKNKLAAKKFEKAAKKWPDSILEEDALYFAAECRFFSDEYPKAMWLYDSLIHKYHSTRYMNTATRRLFAIGRYWDKLDRNGASTLNFTDGSRPRAGTFSGMQKSYESIFINDPSGPLADDSVMALAEAYMVKGQNEGDSQFEKAAFYYAYLRENFHDSPHVSKAFEREIKARQMAYLGDEYDGKTLETAEKLANQTLVQYNGDPKVDTGAVREISNEITDQKAKREWVFGQYYDKKKEYRSARIYYQRIIKDHSASAFALKAQKRLGEIKDLPDEPYGFEQWVNDIFPSRTKKDY